MIHHWDIDIMNERCHYTKEGTRDYGELCDIINTAEKLYGNYNDGMVTTGTQEMICDEAERRGWLANDFAKEAYENAFKNPCSMEFDTYAYQKLSIMKEWDRPAIYYNFYQSGDHKKDKSLKNILVF